MMDPTKLALIRQYVNAGIYVYPVYVTRGADGKKDVRPIGRWREGSSRSLADIEAWWGDLGEHQDAGVLVDCGKSGLVVVDADGKEGITNWLDLCEEPAFSFVRTVNGGLHYWFRAHPDHVIGNDQSGKVAEKVDVRGLGGFVIAPPTEGYEWHGHVDLSALPVVPQVVIERMTATKGQPAREAVQGEVRAFTEAEATAFVKREYEKLRETKVGFNGAINNFAMACAHFPQWYDRQRCARLVIKALKETTGWTAPDRDDLKTIDSAYSATEAGRSWVAVEREKSSPGATGEDPQDTMSSALTLPPPSQPLAVARALVDRMDHTEGEIHYSWWQGEFYQWVGTHWEIMPLARMERWIYEQTGDATYKHMVKEEFEDRPWAPNRKKVGDLVHALGVGTLQHYGEDEKCLALANGVLDLKDRALKPHRPSRFNLSSRPFDYEPDLECPRWCEFLESALPGDQLSQEFLAEWFGYVLSGRTDMQKMASLVGEPRSGKGTIARILTAMLGKESVTGTDLGSLGDHFGRADLIGKSLAVMGDVRWNARNAGEAVPFLLGIIGEDTQTVARKHRDDWTGRMGTRFMVMGNDVPRFSDRSGALAQRMIHVKFGVSFAGRENLDLERQLLEELPGILNWSLAGLNRLEAQKRFTVPESSADISADVRRGSNPVGEFLEDCCEFGEDKEILLDHLYEKYKGWCDLTGRTHDRTMSSILSREVQKVAGVTATRPRVNGRRVTQLHGVTSTWI